MITVAADLLFMGVLILLVFLLFRGGRKRKTSPLLETRASEQGRSTRADEPFELHVSRDLGEMVKALSIKTNPIDRHFLFKSIVEETYKKRKVPEMRKIFREVGEKHLLEFENLVQPLKNRFNGTLPRVPTFQYLATVLSEDGEYEYAIEVCKTALGYGLHDNTKSGFEGRIKRIARLRRKQIPMKS
jgi:hypothetical protein